MYSCGILFRAGLMVLLVVQALAARTIARKAAMAAKLNTEKTNGTLLMDNMTSLTEKHGAKPLPRDEAILSRFCPAGVIPLVYGEHGPKVGRSGGAGILYTTGKGAFVEKHISEASSILVQSVPASWVEVELNVGSLQLPFNLANRDVSMITKELEDKDCSRWDWSCPQQCASCRTGKPGELGKFHCILNHKFLRFRQQTHLSSSFLNSSEQFSPPPRTSILVQSKVPGYECDPAQEREHPHPKSFETYCKCPKFSSPEMIVVMPVLKGGDLYDWVAPQEGLGYKRTLRVAAQLAFGIWSLHEKGVMSRDIKLINMMKVSKDPTDLRVTHIDYGIAKKCDISSKPACGKEWTGGLESMIGKKMLDRPLPGGLVCESERTYGLEVDWGSLFIALPQIAGLRGQYGDILQEKVGEQIREYVRKFQTNYQKLRKTFQSPRSFKKVHGFKNVHKHPVLGDSFWTKDKEFLDELGVNHASLFGTSEATTKEFWTRVCEVYSDDPCLCPGQCYKSCSKEVLEPLRAAYASLDAVPPGIWATQKVKDLRDKLKQMRKASVSNVGDCANEVAECETPYCHSCCECTKALVAGEQIPGSWCQHCPQSHSEV